MPRARAYTRQYSFLPTNRTIASPGTGTRGLSAKSCHLGRSGASGPGQQFSCDVIFGSSRGRQATLQKRRASSWGTFSMEVLGGLADSPARSARCSAAELFLAAASLWRSPPARSGDRHSFAGAGARSLNSPSHRHARSPQHQQCLLRRNRHKHHERPCVCILSGSVYIRCAPKTPSRLPMVRLLPWTPGHGKPSTSR